MADLKNRLRTKLFRRVSSAVPATTGTELSTSQHEHHHRQTPGELPSRKKPAKKSSLTSIRSKLSKGTSVVLPKSSETENSSGSKNEDAHARPDTGEWSDSMKSGDGQTLQSSIISYSSTAQSPGVSEAPPDLVIQEPTPNSPPARNPLLSQAEESSVATSKSRGQPLHVETVERKPSLVAKADAEVIQALLEDNPIHPPVPARSPTERHALGGFTARALDASMLHRRVWVKRPGSAATIVLIREDDLVDDAKDSILRKYANQLGRHYDAPDITIRLLTRGQPGERIMSPDEPFCRTIDSYYPGGQGVDEALLIDVPPRRTPRPSPRGQPNPAVSYYHHQQQEELRPHESGNDYFPPMPPVTGMPSPLLTATSHESRPSHAAHERAMSVLATGQVPSLPSPGGTRRAHVNKQHRPLHGRQNTSPPTALSTAIASRSNRPRLDSSASNDKHAVSTPAAPPLPTPPIPEAGPISKIVSNPPTPRVASPRPSKGRKTRQKQVPDGPSLPPGLTLLDTSMPPINVLIVEDNIINMKLLEQFVRRLGVRWHTAVNGREAVQRWRNGGYHLVLMDIQLPIMSGLEATREIRRLERVNNIGVFSSSSASEKAPEDIIAPDQKEVGAAVKEEDRLADVGRLFKSPVIIVALTASNLQSDRHEALAAGCNDFLTKPVNFVWFERKVKEWGCMQALIDFDGWRKWEDFASENGLKDPRDIKTGPKASASRRGREIKSTALQPNASTTNLVSSFSPKPNGTSAQDFATAPKKSIGETLAEEDAHLKKEDSPDTIVNVTTGA